LQPGDIVVSVLGDGEGASDSDFIFSKKRPPGAMIKLLSSGDMFPVRLVAIRSTDGKALPTLADDPTEDDYANARKSTSSPDYMKGISTGQNDAKVQMAKYRQQVAEQRKKMASRERRSKERQRLNQRAANVNRRERNVKERRMLELNTACDDVEEAWINWKVGSKQQKQQQQLQQQQQRDGRLDPAQQRSPKRQGTALEKHRMRARLEVLKTLEETEVMAGDKVGAMAASRLIAGLGYVNVGGKGDLVKNCPDSNPHHVSQSPRNARLVEASPSSTPSSSSLFRDSSKTQQPAPPKAGTSRRQWHLFQPNPDLEQKRRKILQQRRKRSSWQKERQRRQQQQVEHNERKLKRQIREQEEQKLKYAGGGRLRTKNEDMQQYHEEAAVRFVPESTMDSQWGESEVGEDGIGSDDGGDFNNNIW
jgi:hypothetical protein